MSKYNIDLNLNDKNALSIIIKKIKHNSTVLEFGPANGRMTKYLKEELNCQVYTVELDKKAARDAEKYSQEIVVGNIEDYKWLHQYKNISFDYIVFADVLEHLYDPKKVILQAKTLLKKDGSFLISLPNIAHNAIIMDLLNDKFTYQATGLLDNTHIRFFTKKTIDDFIRACGLKIAFETGVFYMPEETEFGYKYTEFDSRTASSLFHHEWGEIYQFILEAKVHVDNPIINFERKMHSLLFFDTGKGFNSSEVLQTTFSIDNKKITFNINEDINNVTAIRIDPLEYSLQIDINKILINNKPIELTTIQHNGLATKSNKFYFLHNDPQFIIKLNQSISLKSVVFYFNSISNILDVPSLRLMEKEQQIQEKEQQIQEKEQQIQEKEQQIQEKEQQIQEKEQQIQYFFSLAQSMRLKNRLKKIIKKTIPISSYSHIKKGIQHIKQKEFLILTKKIFLKRSTILHKSSFNSYKSTIMDLSNKNILYVFPVIDWKFRIQRPQQLAKEFQNNGYQVIYFSTKFNIDKNPGFVYETINNNILLVTLFLNEEKNIYTEKLSPSNIDFLLKSILKIEQAFQTNKRISIIDHPFWIELANKLSGSYTIYDCMDYHAGFGDESSYLLELEEEAMSKSDLLILTSEDLYSRFSKKNHNSILVRNGCEYSYFNTIPNKIMHYKKGKTIGYYGAISSWFDAELVASLAQRLPDYEFILVGSTYGCEDIDLLRNIKNIILTGEVDYNDLTKYLYAFDIAIMPFKINKLTMATNPVKIYEYLSAGKPVVSTKLPEVELMGEVVYLATDIDDFDKVIKEAINENNTKLQNKRMEFAKNNDWTSRFNAITSTTKISQQQKPKISIVIVTYNNLEITKACLKSMEKYNNYENCEIIIVDNLSTDGTRDYLTSYCAKHKNITCILHNENSGFAAGNNIGIKETSGEYIILLNNDTYVTPNWIQNLIYHFDIDNKIGMVGPRTNNIGNEARMETDYNNMNEMINLSYSVYYSNLGKQYEIDVLAFFCVAIKREVIESVGLLDEVFGIGMFEDDDYCIRTKNMGYKLICADDVFIHHHLGASFNKNLEWKEKLFQKNKKIFEDRYGTWVPHKYRDN